MKRAAGAAPLIMAIGLIIIAPAATAAGPSIRWTEIATSKTAADKKLVSEIYNMEWWQACVAWGREYRANKGSRREQAFHEYLDYKHYLLPSDESHINDRSIAIGMGECGVFAAKGRPDAVNSTETSRGRTSQIVYRAGHVYVYTEPRDDFALNVVRSYQY